MIHWAAGSQLTTRLGLGGITASRVPQLGGTADRLDDAQEVSLRKHCVMMIASLRVKVRRR
jgi:hypothetical protein